MHLEKSIIFIPIFLFTLYLLGCSNTVDEENEAISDSTIQSSTNKITSESSVYDTLAKYSYLINSIKDGRIDGGATGFFTTDKGKLYLLSNYHVFTCSNTFTKELEEIQYDTLLLRYQKNNRSEFFYDTIDIREIKRKNRPAFYYDKPDVFRYEIELPKDAKIYTINEFLNGHPSGTINDIIIYGYPSDSDVPTLLLSKLYQSQIFGFYDITLPGKKVSVGSIYFTVPASTGGFSGSPVFWQVTLPDSTRDIVFGGVLSSHFQGGGGNPDSGKTMIINPTAVGELFLNK